MTELGTVVLGADLEHFLNVCFRNRRELVD